MFKYDFSVRSTQQGCFLDIQPLNSYKPMQAMRALRKEVEMFTDAHMVSVRVFTPTGELWMSTVMGSEEFLNTTIRVVDMTQQLLEAEQIIRDRGILE